MGGMEMPSSAPPRRGNASPEPDMENVIVPLSQRPRRTSEFPSERAYQIPPEDGMLTFGTSRPSDTAVATAAKATPPDRFAGGRLRLLMSRLR